MALQSSPGCIVRVCKCDDIVRPSRLVALRRGPLLQLRCMRRFGKCIAFSLDPALMVTPKRLVAPGINAVLQAAQTVSREQSVNRTGIRRCANALWCFDFARELAENKSDQCNSVAASACAHQVCMRVSLAAIPKTRSEPCMVSEKCPKTAA